MPEVAVVLPTYNEADNLPELVRELESLGIDLQLLIIDDNSQDGTQRVARELSDTFGNVTVIERPSKLGLGSALRLGLSEALATGAQYLITMDADCSHDPRDIPRLLDAMRSAPALSSAPQGSATSDIPPADLIPADLIQGSRYVEGGGILGMALARRVSSRIANLFYHWCAGGPHESTTNFRAYSRRAATLVVARTRAQHYEFMPEAVLLVRAAGLRIGEVPIVFTNRVRGNSKVDATEVIRGIVSVFTTTLQYRLRLGRFARHIVADPAPAE